MLYVKNGKLEVRAPLNASKCDIDMIVASKEGWVRKKLAASNERLAQRGSFRLTYGDYVTYRGKQYPIAAKPGNRLGFDEMQFYMPPGLSPEQIKAACIQIYRLLAKRDLTNRALDFAAQMSVAPTAVKITGAKTLWGSCSGRKSINFSWRLIMADDSVIDYVVVHELAHLINLNHSKEFWKVVGDTLPDYKERQARLKDLQRRLASEDWEG